MSTTPPPPPAPACPRCGHDLSGIAATWAIQCPTRGTCSECGHDFGWADHLHPARDTLHGLLEHARGISQSFRWTLTTLGWMVLPHRFWSRIEKRHTTRARRVVLLALAIALVAQLGNGISLVVINYEMWAMLERETKAPMLIPSLITAFTEPFFGVALFPDQGGTKFIIEFSRFPLFSVYASALAVLLIAWPLMFAVMTTTRRHERLTWKQVQRAAAYPLLAASLLLLAWQAFGVYAAIACSDSLPDRIEDASFMSVAAGFCLRVIPCALIPIWVLAWWYSAMTRGWKVDRARLLWVIFCAASLVASALVAIGFVMAFMLTESD